MNAFKEYLLDACKGAAQVIFQPSAACGALFIAALAAGWAANGAPGAAAFAGALVALAAATAAGRRYPAECRQGLCGFNAILTGCAALTFLAPGTGSVVLLVAAALLTLPLKRWLDKLLSAWQLPSLTMPFILCTWVLLAAARALGLEGAGAPHDAVAAPGAAALAAACLKGLSQIFLVDSWTAGLLIAAGLWLSGRRAALLALGASAAAMAVAAAAGCPWSGISQGLWGFSPALTAVAVGDAFRSRLPGGRFAGALTVVAAVLLTVALQIALQPLSAATGFPILTLPFCLATWIALAFVKIPKREADSRGPLCG